VAECDFVRILKWFDAWIFAATLATPGSDHPCEWIEILMKSFGDCECHLVLPLLSGLGWDLTPGANSTTNSEPDERQAEGRATCDQEI
jgi:hypothetical protein